MFRFTVRDLLWLTFVVAVGLGWFVREQSWVSRERWLEAEAKAQAGRAVALDKVAGVLQEWLKERGWHASWTAVNEEQWSVGGESYDLWQQWERGVSAELP